MLTRQISHAARCHIVVHTQAQDPRSIYRGLQNDRRGWLCGANNKGTSNTSTTACSGILVYQTLKQLQREMACKIETTFCYFERKKLTLGVKYKIMQFIF